MDEKELLEIERDLQVVRKLVRRLDPELVLGLLTGALLALIIEDMRQQSKRR